MQQPTIDGIRPMQISEIIIHTANYEQVRDWYRKVFNDVVPAMETDCKGRMSSIPMVERLCFLRLVMGHPFTQILGIFEIPQAFPSEGVHAGLDHMQFREESRESLFSRYEKLKRQGILPFQTYDHGPGTSFYYHDPDGNVVELSALNFETEAEYLAFFQTEAFRSNIEGVAIDADAYIRSVREKSPLHAAGTGEPK